MFFETECFLLFFLFLLTVEKLRYKSSLYLKRALRAELLAAEAPYTFFAIYFRLFLFNSDRLCGTDTSTYAATDTHIGDELRLSAQNGGGNSSEHSLAGIFLLAEKLKRTALNHALEALNTKSVGASYDHEILCAVRNESAAVGSVKYRKLLTLKADKLGSKHIKSMG